MKYLPLGQAVHLYFLRGSLTSSMGGDTGATVGNGVEMWDGDTVGWF